ncbi:hypothetical protein JX265_013762 [Neoarthrinium moseri]|uniref:Acid phosphatase n=1 Tax=Neoarthrinium moseri TaxID=1658444 RepID=A0A9P9W844_9PEZI|nr:hypothetical protein JX265_013762 [Neoarthrinium moseri]
MGIYDLEEVSGNNWARWEIDCRTGRSWWDEGYLLPQNLSDASILYVRTTEVPRVVESVQQILHGLYPSESNHTSTPWTVAMRSRADETLLPNTKSCARLAELTRAFARDAANRWNQSDDMRYLSKKLGKWMPGNKALTLDSRPTLSALMDTINATRAHGPSTRLPDEFYDERVREVIDRIVIDEQFRGYGLSRELRILGVGQLMGDIVLKMVDQVEWRMKCDTLGGTAMRSGGPPKLSLLGCHDRTIGVVLASLGCLGDSEQWPPFTSHIIFELFSKRTPGDSDLKEDKRNCLPRNANTSLTSIADQGGLSKLQGIGQRPVTKYTTNEEQTLDEYFVRVKYNDRIMTIPGCRVPGKHFDGDVSLCTLVSIPD